jgi:hypothetical protein
MKANSIKDIHPGMLIIYEPNSPDSKVEGIVSNVYSTIVQFNTKNDHQFISVNDIHDGYINVFSMDENPEMFL